jgi:hypothetical protein
VCVCEIVILSVYQNHMCVCVCVRERVSEREIVMLSVYQNKCGYETIILPLCDMQMRLSAVNRLKGDG